MKSSSPIGGLLFAILLVIVAGAAALSLHTAGRPGPIVDRTQDTRAVVVSDLGPLPPEVRESSGLVVSRAYPGVFWTHNDSGDEPRLYAMDSTAALIATIDVRGAGARDWEAMDVGVCPRGSVEVGGPLTADPEWCLYVADTGDNARRRESVTVYVIPEPSPFTSDHDQEIIAAVVFSYDDGPFDVEALAVTPDGDLLLATKGRRADRWLFQIPAADVRRVGQSGEALTLTSSLRVPIRRGRLLTGASLNRDGSILALRTYLAVYFYRWPPDGALVEAQQPCVLGRLEPIGEAVAFSADDRLFVTSESPGRQIGHLLEIACPGMEADSLD